MLWYCMIWELHMYSFFTANIVVNMCTLEFDVEAEECSSACEGESEKWNCSSLHLNWQITLNAHFMNQNCLLCLITAFQRPTPQGVSPCCPLAWLLSAYRIAILSLFLYAEHYFIIKSFWEHCRSIQPKRIAFFLLMVCKGESSALPVKYFYF